MLQSYSLHTSEIDDVDAALQDINTQISAFPLLKNSVGIVACHYDFISGGVLKALEESLPFPLIGITTFYQRTAQVSGLFELTITVLTSDDVCFAVANCTPENSAGTPAEKVQSTYEKAFAIHGQKPSAIFSFLTINRPVTGDEYLRLLDQASGGVPSFGGITTGDDDTGSNIFVVCQGTVLEEGFAILLLVGNVEANFYYGNCKTENLLQMTATVTKATENALEELNGQPAAAYLYKHGFELDEESRDRISVIPYLYKMPDDDAIIARTMCGFTPGGELRFLGEIPENALFRIGTNSMKDVLDTTQKTIETAVQENGDAALMLLFSCIGRYITLGMDPTSEMERVAQCVPAGLPYLACYVGGEICPTGTPGAFENHYHNASFIICTLK